MILDSQTYPGMPIDEKTKLFQRWRHEGIIPEDVEFSSNGGATWLPSQCFAYGHTPEVEHDYRINPKAFNEYHFDLDPDPPVYGPLTQKALEEFTPKSEDVVNNPSHYTSHPSGVECIQITEHMSFCVGNAVKYLWRAGLKDDRLQDLKKAEFYIKREIERLSK